VSWLVTTTYDVGAFGVTALLVALAVLARRWEVARDIGLSVIGAAASSVVLMLALGTGGGRSSPPTFNGYDVHFPVLQIAIFMGVATAALPYLARGVQRVIEGFVALVALAGVVGGHGLPINVLGSLAIGWGTTAAVHLVFGSPLGLPSTADVAALLRQFGIRTDDVGPWPYQTWGVAQYWATRDRGRSHPVRYQISVHGRDAIDARLLAKLGRFLFYRDSGPTLTFTRLQEVEREAYLILWAGRAGVRVPEVVSVGTAGPSRDAVLICRSPDGSPLREVAGDDVSDAVANDLFAELRRLRAAGIAHGAISGRTIFVDRVAETTTLIDFRNAVSNADQELFDRDVASAMAAQALVMGPDRAAAAAEGCLTAEDMIGALRHLRRVGLDPALASELRGKKELLEALRTKAAEAKGVDIPELAEPRRISWPTLVLVVGSLIGGWALIGTLLNVLNAFDTIVGASWGWVVLAFFLAQLAFVASAVQDLGSVSGALPFGPVLGLEVANSFTALAGGAPAKFATRVRFFQQRGYEPSLAVSSGAVVSAVSWVVKGVLLLIAIPLAWSSIDVDVSPTGGGNTQLVWTLLALVLGVGVLSGLALAIPRFRRLAASRLLPRVSRIWHEVRDVVRTPNKLIRLAGGSLGTELAVALALSASLRAFGDHLSLATLILVISLAAMFGGVSPVPGGMGVVEAGLILGLTAAGISEVDATAAVFIQRLFSSYLPPIWGWVTLIWMRRREYV
jgi:uncharacterized membrane protein YbhN (UPF0104 family)